MKRYAQIIELLPEKKEEYMKLHEVVWPEIAKLIYDCNIRNYSIFYRNNLLYAYYEYIGNDFEANMKKMEDNPINKKWWGVCKPCHKPLDDRKEGEWWASLDEIWHQD